jgi:hypothetical protein
MISLLITLWLPRVDPVRHQNSPSGGSGPSKAAGPPRAPEEDPHVPAQHCR